MSKTVSKDRNKLLATGRQILEERKKALKRSQHVPTKSTEQKLSTTSSTPASSGYYEENIEKEMMKLQLRVRAQSSRIEALLKERSDSRSGEMTGNLRELAELRNQLGQRDRWLAEAENSVADMQAKLESAVRELAAMSKQLQETRESSTGGEEAARQLREENEELKTTLAQTQQQTKDVRQKLGETVADQQKRLNEAVCALEQSKTDQNTLRRERDEAAVRVLELKEEVEALKEKQQQHQEITSEPYKNTGAQEEHSARDGGPKDSIQDADEAWKNHREQIAALNSLLAEQITLRKSAEAEKIRRQKLHAKSVKNMELALQDKTHTIDQLQVRLDGALSATKEEHQKVQMLSRANGHLQQELVRVNEENEVLNREILKRHKQCTLGQGATNSLEENKESERVGESAKEPDKSKEQEDDEYFENNNNFIGRELSRLKKDKKDLIQAMEQQRKTYEQVLNQKASLCDQYAKVVDRSKTLLEENKDLKARLGALETQLRTAAPLSPAAIALAAAQQSTRKKKEAMRKKAKDSSTEEVETTQNNGMAAATRTVAHLEKAEYNNEQRRGNITPGVGRVQSYLPSRSSGLVPSVVVVHKKGFFSSIPILNWFYSRSLLTSVEVTV